MISVELRSSGRALRERDAQCAAKRLKNILSVQKIYPLLPRGTGALLSLAQKLTTLQFHDFQAAVSPQFQHAPLSSYRLASACLQAILLAARSLYAPCTKKICPL
jgi:hypothetical protein